MLEIRGTGLGVPEIVSVARNAVPVRLAARARERVEQARAFADEVAASRPVYGRSTGVGANRHLSVDDPAAAASRLLRSHATSSGPVRSTERVRAMLVVRLGQLAAAGNGIGPWVLDALVDLLTGDALPEVREGGSIGTGDLAALATVALALETERPLGAGDALAFLSSNAGVVGDAALAVHDLDRLARSALVVAALSFEAVRGNAEAFSPAALAATPFAGAARVGTTLRGLVAPADPARIQDPFGLRTLPQVHGPLLDRLAETTTVVQALANTGSENPALSPELGVAHHGGFHAAYLGQALDALRLSLAQAAQLGLARVSMLNDPELTRQPAFLGDGTPGASGVMLLEYDAAASLAELRRLAAPAGLSSVTLSRGVEEDASFAAQAARQALAAVAPYRALVAAELVAARRCVVMAGRDLGPVLTGVVADVAGLDGDLADRDLSADLATAARALDALADLRAVPG
ncbi:MAG: aromatic amino acid lyase [Nocardioides sp.]